MLHINEGPRYGTIGFGAEPSLNLHPVVGLWELLMVQGRVKSCGDDVPCRPVWPPFQGEGVLVGLRHYQPNLELGRVSVS